MIIPSFWTNREINHLVPDGPMTQPTRFATWHAHNKDSQNNMMNRSVVKAIKFQVLCKKNYNNKNKLFFQSPKLFIQNIYACASVHVNVTKYILSLGFKQQIKLSAQKALLTVLSAASKTISLRTSPTECLKKLKTFSATCQKANLEAPRLWKKNKYRFTKKRRRKYWQVSTQLIEVKILKMNFENCCW